MIYQKKLTIIIKKKRNHYHFIFWGGGGGRMQFTGGDGFQICLFVSQHLV